MTPRLSDILDFLRDDARGSNGQNGTCITVECSVNYSINNISIDRIHCGPGLFTYVVCIENAGLPELPMSLFCVYNQLDV